MQITYVNKQVGIYEVACWLLQYNKISFEAINKLTVYSVYIQRSCYFLNSY